MDTPLPIQRTKDETDAGLSSRWALVFVSVFTLSLVVFLAIPGSIEGKSLAVLHGLCAQQPTHSLYFGEQRLPFDARMTGIYGGFAVAGLYMLLRGRWRAGLLPPISVIVAMVVFIGVLAIDGVNSTLLDLRMWHLYEPRNAVRLGTGLLTGTSLAIFVWMLVAQVGFARDARQQRAPIAGVFDLGVLVAVQVIVGLVVYLRPEYLRVPLTLLLLGSALIAITGLTLAFVLLLTRSENSARATRELASYATIALVISLLIIGLAGGGRFALEAWLDIDPTVQRGVEE